MYAQFPAVVVLMLWQNGLSNFPYKENKCAIILLMDINTTQQPGSHKFDRSSSLAHTWLRQEQQHLADKVGEPLFVTIRLVYDGFVEVEVETFSGRHGMAGGDLLSETMAAAVACLLYLDGATELSPQQKA